VKKIKFQLIEIGQLQFPLSFLPDLEREREREKWVQAENLKPHQTLPSPFSLFSLFPLKNKALKERVKLR
jgi:hypothetical protein